MQDPREMVAEAIASLWRIHENDHRKLGLPGDPEAYADSKVNEMSLAEAMRSIESSLRYDIYLAGLAEDAAKHERG